MGKKILTALIISAIVTIFMAAGALKATEEQEFPDEIVLDNQGYKTDRKGPVTFSHLDHAEDYEIACNECHHEYEDGKNTWKEGDPVNKCMECHAPEESDGNIKKLSIAFHKNCKGCHKKLAREGSTDAPFKQCTECHEKKS